LKHTTCQSFHTEQPTCAVSKPAEYRHDKGKEQSSDQNRSSYVFSSLPVGRPRALKSTEKSVPKPVRALATAVTTLGEWWAMSVSFGRTTIDQRDSALTAIKQVTSPVGEASALGNNPRNRTQTTTTKAYTRED
jgi:hypothetical protein